MPQSKRAARSRLLLVERDAQGVDRAYGPIFSSRKKLLSYTRGHPPEYGGYHDVWTIPYNPED